MLARFVKIAMLTWIAVQGPASNQSVDKDYVMADKIIVSERDAAKIKAEGINGYRLIRICKIRDIPSLGGVLFRA